MRPGSSERISDASTPYLLVHVPVFSGSKGRACCDHEYVSRHTSTMAHPTFCEASAHPSKHTHNWGERNCNTLAATAPSHRRTTRRTDHRERERQTAHTLHKATQGNTNTAQRSTLGCGGRSCGSGRDALLGSCYSGGARLGCHLALSFSPHLLLGSQAVLTGLPLRNLLQQAQQRNTAARPQPHHKKRVSTGTGWTDCNARAGSRDAPARPPA